MEYLFLFLRGLELFFLVFIRMFAMFAFTPLFNNATIPVRARGFIAIAITIVCITFLEQSVAYTPARNLIEYGFFILNEAMVGFCIGFSILIFFSIYQVSAQFFSFQIGFGISSVFDPLSQVQIPLTGQLQTLIGMLIFISIGGMESAILAVIRSYNTFPIGGLHKVITTFPGVLAKSFFDSFRIAAQIALPIMATLFIITATLGILAKFAPQMNLLMIGFPIYIMFGLLFLIMYAPTFINFTGNVLKEAFNILYIMFTNGGGS